MLVLQRRSSDGSEGRLLTQYLHGNGAVMAEFRSVFGDTQRRFVAVAGRLLLLMLMLVLM